MTIARAIFECKVVSIVPSPDRRQGPIDRAGRNGGLNESLPASRNLAHAIAPPKTVRVRVQPAVIAPMRRTSNIWLDVALIQS